MDLDQLEWEERRLVREIDELQRKLVEVRAEYRAKLDDFSEQRAALVSSRLTTAGIDTPHHRAIIRRFLADHPDLKPTQAVAYSSWGYVPQMPEAGQDVLIFVDGGVLYHELDVGRASLVNDGGIIAAPLRCGILSREGGITYALVEQRRTKT